MKTAIRNGVSVLFCFFLCFCFNRTAYAEMTSGTYGDINWTLYENGLLEITGNGEIADFYSPSDAWRAYERDIRSVVIRKGITRIGSQAFRFCNNCISISIPDGVTSIGWGAFIGCNMPDVIIPNSVTEIEPYVFSGCDGLKAINVSSNNSSYSSIDGILYDKDVKTLIACPGGIPESIIIPDSVTYIYPGAFAWCNITSITIPNSVSIIDADAFFSCDKLEKLIIPNSVTFIGSRAFSDCKGIKSVEISNNLTDLPSELFKNCKNLVNVIIPKSVTRLDMYVFEGCTSLTSVSIPRSLTYIDDGAFSGCANLEDVYYEGSTAQWDGINIHPGNNCLINANFHYNCYEGSQQYIQYVDWHGNKQTVFLPNSIEELIFQSNSDIYNPELAYYLMLLANAAYDPDCIYSSLESQGFSSYTILNSDDYQDEDRYANYSFARKELPDGRLLVMITVRGTHGLTEWLRTDFDLGISVGPRVHKGFSDSSNNLLSSLQGYLGDIPASNVVYVLTGHSLGAAVANLTAVRLQNMGVPRNNIYDYNFACPDVAKEEASGLWKNPNSMYSNVFNIADARDLVSYVPGVLGNVVEAYVKRHLLPGDSAFTWGKFGLSRWFSYDWNNIGEVEYNPTTHYGDNYIYYLHSYQPFSTYKTYEEVKLHRSIDRLTSPLKVICGFCPVNIIIYDSGGNPVASVVDDVVEYYTSNFGEVIIYTEEDMKVIALPNNQNYNVQFVATDEGTMSYEVLDADLVTGDFYEEKSFDSVAIIPGKTLVSNVGVDTETSDVKLYVVNEDNVPISEVHEDGTEEALIASGKWGDLIWALDTEGMLTVTGKGDMLPLGRETVDQNGNLDYEPIGEAWQNYRFSIREAILSEGITSIGDLAFYDCKQLARITLPESLLRIGKHAFSYSSLLPDITMPSSVSQIDDYAFCLCNGFTNITIPEGVSSLGKYAFLFCENLESVVLPDGILTVDDATFFGCAKLQQIRLPNDLQRIGAFSFSSCSSLDNLFLSNSITIIDFAAFNNCTNLINVFFHGTAEQWSQVTINEANEVFTNALIHFPDIILPAALNVIGEDAFNKGAFAYIMLPENAVSIGWHAFADCPNLSYIYIPALTTQIDEEAFGNMQSLTILGKTGSTAETYVQNHHYDFIAVP